jgi:hypothetical protein
MTIVLSSIGLLSVMARFHLPTHHVYPVIMRRSARCSGRSTQISHAVAVVAVSQHFRY